MVSSLRFIRDGILPLVGKHARGVRPWCLVLASSILSTGLSPAQEITPNVVIQWNEATLQAIRDTKPGPPMAARALAMVHTCIYDAWAAYDEYAVGTRFGTWLRQHPSKRTVTNINEAISFAAYYAAADLFPADRATVFDPLMTKLGYDPQNSSLGVETPSKLGTLVCAAVLHFRHHDGSNQLGNLTPTGVPYADYTGYVPVNPPSTLPVNPFTVVDLSRWQPLQYHDIGGTLVTQKFVGAQWNQVIPFALTSSDQFREQMPGPAAVGSAAFLAECRELVFMSGHLTDQQKMIAEYWADGPNSELPPGHWSLFAQAVSTRDHHELAADVKLFFVLTNALFDGSIVAWDAKRVYDSVRPVTAIPFLFQGQRICAWGGPFRGAVFMDGAEWIPYQPATFPTPPFPEYISGHSTFSAAGAEILQRFTGSDRFGHSVTLPAGSSKVEPGLTPVEPVTLFWKTFSEAANQAGISRRYGGIHFETGDRTGRAMGRLVANQAWCKAVKLWRDHRSHGSDCCGE